MGDSMVAGMVIGGLRTMALDRLIEVWEPKGVPQCAGCLNARVGGTPEEPTARCRAFPEAVVPLERLIRVKWSKGFRDAANCRQFDPAEDLPRIVGRKVEYAEGAGDAEVA